MSVTFLSGVRHGLASRVGGSSVDSSGRAQVGAVAAVNGKDAKEISIAVLGPGDVAGIEGQVLRMDPAPGTTDAEPTLFCAVEFDRPDFPWLFTPRSPSDGRLAPWLVLVVVPVGDGVTLDVERADRLPVLTVDDPSQLPPLADSWAWTHAQVAGSAASTAAATAAVRGPPESSLSRLLCPRRLESHRRYLACVVPAFAAGADAGLGAKPTSGAAWAWPRATQPPVRLPVYHHWEFATGAPRNFETLVRGLRAPRHRDPPVVVPGGGRWVDISSPGPDDMAAPGARLRLFGALKPANATTQPWGDATAAEALADLLALGSGAQPAGQPLIVTPPVYGARAAGEPGLPAAAPPRPLWLHQLNLDPRHRAVAGLGARIVQRNQEELMAAAWEQAPQIEEANDRLRAGRTARLVLKSLLTTRLEALPAARLLQLVGPALHRLPAPPAGIPLPERLTGTTLPLTVTLPAFRRLTRRAGPIGRRAFTPTVGIAELLAGLDAGTVLPDRTRTRRAGGMVTARGLLGVLGAAREAVTGGGWIAVDTEHLAPTGPGARTPTVLVEGAAGRERAGTVRIRDPSRSVGATGRLAGDLRLASRPAIDRMLAALERPDTVRELPGTWQAQADDASADLTAEAKLALERSLANWAAPPPHEPPGADLDALGTDIVAVLDPADTITSAVHAFVHVPDALQQQDPLADVLVAPSFPTPLVHELLELAPDLLLPGADRVPPETVFAVESNPEFVQALLTGANEEMARELRWRGFPTDERGTCFRMFWDRRGTTEAGAEPPDIDELHRLARAGRLGAGAAARAGGMVFLIRSELLRRFPGTQVYAVPAEGDPRRPRLDADELPSFRGTLGADISYFGFTFTEAQATGSPGRYAVLQQPPVALRFGLDDEDERATDEWPSSTSDLRWDHVTVGSEGYIEVPGEPLSFPAEEGWVQWGATAALQARITYQQPVRVAIHFSDLI